MQHGAGLTPPRDLEMQQRFRRRLARRRSTSGARAGVRMRRGDRDAALVAQQDVRRAQLAFVDRARGDGESKRLSRRDDAEVAAGAEHPAARVEAPADLDEPRGDLGRTFARHSRDSTTIDAEIGSGLEHELAESSLTHVGHRITASACPSDALGCRAASA